MVVVVIHMLFPRGALQLHEMLRYSSVRGFNAICCLYSIVKKKRGGREKLVIPQCAIDLVMIL